MNFEENEEIVALRDMLRRYLASDCPIEDAATWDREDSIPRKELLKLGELGICGICVPEEFGGLGFNVIGMVAVIEELARYSAGLATY